MRAVKFITLTVAVCVLWVSIYPALFGWALMNAEEEAAAQGWACMWQGIMVGSFVLIIALAVNLIRSRKEKESA
jgi:membrane protein DedA with SNARE-associated domain